MAEYRSTPERQRLIERITRAYDTRQAPGHPIWPNPQLEALEALFENQDRVIAQYGDLIRFDWTVTDQAGESLPAEGYSTDFEALQYAIKVWKAIGYKPVGELTVERQNRPEQK